MVVVGIVLVGLASMLFSDKDASTHSNKEWLGIVLILSAQVVVATQFTYEEKYIGKYEVPALLAVGWEGVWGFTMLMVILPVLQFVKVDGKPIEDSWEAMQQIANDYIIMLAMWGSVLSIAFFNFFGISVTKYMSATHRTMIDSARTLLIWAFALAVGWEKFLWLQAVGAVALIYGTSLYNHVFDLFGQKHLARCMSCLPIWCWQEDGDEEDDERKPLLGDGSVQGGERARPGQSGRLPRVGSFEDLMSSDVESPPPPGARSPAQIRMRYYQRLHGDAGLDVPHFVVESLGNFRSVDGVFTLSRA